MEILEVYPEQIQAIADLVFSWGSTVSETDPQREQKLFELWLQKLTGWPEDSFNVVKAIFSDGSSTLALDSPSHLSQAEGFELVENLLLSLTGDSRAFVPRCETCQHFKSSTDRSALGYCTRAKPNLAQATTLNVELTAIATSLECKPAILHVSPDFGCVMHKRNNDDTGN